MHVVIRPLISILSKMLRHLKIKGENKFMSLRIDDDNLFGKNETTWTKILDWKILN